MVGSGHKISESSVVALLDGVQWADCCANLTCPLAFLQSAGLDQAPAWTLDQIAGLAFGVRDPMTLLVDAG